MGLDYSYTQPSKSEDYGENSADSGYSETEFDIMLDQAEIDAAQVVYPPQPETSYTRTDPGRRLPCLEVMGRRGDGGDESYVYTVWPAVSKGRFSIICY
ncbi:unnamed protein product [Brassica rapa]|uniref:Uncharacterized protein n=1 Tax=Brassica campestris TaxID=3711 RepID=A0A8D9CVH9_BRACM|nr:unnamed protein product [Brassica rapa]